MSTITLSQQNLELTNNELALKVLLFSKVYPFGPDESITVTDHNVKFTLTDANNVYLVKEFIAFDDITLFECEVTNLKLTKVNDIVVLGTSPNVVKLEQVTPQYISVTLRGTLSKILKELTDLQLDTQIYAHNIDIASLE